MRIFRLQSVQSQINQLRLIEVMFYIFFLNCEFTVNTKIFLSVTVFDSLNPYIFLKCLTTLLSVEVFLLNNSRSVRLFFNLIDGCGNSLELYQDRANSC